jgi:hypothetical protein
MQSKMWFIFVLIIIAAICGCGCFYYQSLNKAHPSDNGGILYDPSIHGDLMHPKMSSPLCDDDPVTNIEEYTEPLRPTTITEIEEEPMEPLHSATITEIEEEPTEPLHSATITEIEEEPVRNIKKTKRNKNEPLIV